MPSTFSPSHTYGRELGIKADGGSESCQINSWWKGRSDAKSGVEFSRPLEVPDQLGRLRYFLPRTRAIVDITKEYLPISFMESGDIEQALLNIVQRS
jgi:hypothetical protein